MGNFEKVVVLLILLVCAIVLGISLRSPEPALAAPEIETSDTLSELASTQSGQLETPEPIALTPLRRPEPATEVAAQTAAPSPQLSPIAERPAPVVSKPTAPQPTLLSLVDTQEDRELALVRADDLRPTVSPDHMVYTCRAGDTWHTLAAFYYGQPARADLLQTANEGLERPVAGEPILVPKFDLALEVPDRAPAEPRTEPEFRIYTVEAGDTLSGISSTVYGTASRWMQIYDANRDVLSSPDAVSVGVKLRIP